MTHAELIDCFKKFEGDYLKFDDIAPILRKSKRPDLHAFIMLDQLVPGECDIVSGAGHDEIWLDVDPERLAKKITEAQICDLVRCGVLYDDEMDALSMLA